MRAVTAIAVLALCLVSLPAFAIEWLGTVKVKSLRVHTGRDASSPVVKSLLKNTKVVVESNRRGRSGKSWCGIRQQAKGETLGYVDCDGMTHTMTQDFYDSFSTNPTSVSGVTYTAPSTPQADAGKNKPKAKTKAAKQKPREKITLSSKDLKSRYKGMSAVMYMTPT